MGILDKARKQLSLIAIISPVIIIINKLGLSMKYSMTGRGNKFVFTDHCRRQLVTSGSRNLQVIQSQIYKKKHKKKPHLKL